MEYLRKINEMNYLFLHFTIFIPQNTTDYPHGIYTFAVVTKYKIIITYRI
jgi:hypothetical protein